ncbi:hypothetical protein [Microbacterium sp. P05]|uniref:hypothetical protein n=1 Tax=Microbacterium sp. P05 TaxID=3366948 RepID=UPI003746BA83
MTGGNVVWLKAAIVAIVVLGIGWLFFSPSTVTVGADQTVSCRPLGWEMPGAVSVHGYDSTTNGGAEAIETSLESLGESADEEQEARFRERAEAGLLAACGDARTNRFASIVLVMGASLAVLIVYRTRGNRNEAVVAPPSPVTTSAD